MTTKKLLSATILSLALATVYTTTIAFAAPENINSHFLRKPHHLMTLEERKQIIVPPLKVDIVRSDVYKFLNRINTNRINAGHDILSLTHDLIDESNFIAYRIAENEPLNQSSLKLIIEQGAQSADEALAKILSNPDNVTVLNDEKFTQIGIGCNYHNRNLNFKIAEDGSVIETYDESIPVTITNWVIVLK